MMSELHTQASNFLDFIKTGVDDRTGQFTLVVALPLPPANQLCGPSLSLSLAFSTLGSMVNRGYGLGWNLGLSEIDLAQDNPRLSLSSGEQFAIDLNGSSMVSGGQLAFFDQKLKTFAVTQQADGALRVDRKSGESEILKPPHSDTSRYLLSQLRSPEGRSLYFDWEPFGDDGFVLSKVRDEHGPLLALKVNDSELQFTLHPGKAHAASLRLLLSNDRLSSIHLPAVEQPFLIEYDTRPLPNGARLLLPTRFTGPLGASDLIHWSAPDNDHQLPEGAAFPSLPRVVSWTHVSGETLTELNHTYEWVGDRNFLGHGSDQAFEWRSGRDNLYQVAAEYQYQAIETLSDGTGTPLGSIHRVWNRFHLLISENRRHQGCETRKVTTYAIDPALSWEEQPAWCQLPHEQTTTCIDHSRQGASRRETTSYRYDEFGNIVYTRYPGGVQEQSEYYPAAGEKGCPADPLGMVRHLKKKSVIPASAPGLAPTLSTVYTYMPLPSLIEGASAHIVVASEQGLDETGPRLLEETRSFYDTSTGAHHARVIRSTTTLNDLTTTTVHDYRLEQDELVTETTVIGYEDDVQNRASTCSGQALSTGLTTWERDANGVTTRFAYDTLGRVVQTVRADGSPYRTERLARYHLNDATAREVRPQAAMNPVMIEQQEATGRRVRQWLDGEGRAVCVETEDLDNAPGTFKVIALTVFDALGRQSSQTSIDWLAADKHLSLTTVTHYDGWSEAMQTISPDGVHNHVKHDPVSQRSEYWQSASGVSGPRHVVLHNAAGSPVEEQDFNSDGTLLRSCRLIRDGLDRVIEKRICVTGSADIVTRMEYDHYARVVARTLPDGTRLSWTFAPHSDNQHPESFTVTSAQTQEAP